jgi:hypothetical protein
VTFLRIQVGHFESHRPTYLIPLNKPERQVGEKVRNLDSRSLVHMLGLTRLTTPAARVTVGQRLVTPSRQGQRQREKDRRGG